MFSSVDRGAFWSQSYIWSSLFSFRLGSNNFRMDYASLANRRSRIGRRLFSFFGLQVFQRKKIRNEDIYFRYWDGFTLFIPLNSMKPIVKKTMINPAEHKRAICQL